jgi:hypothetical protein
VSARGIPAQELPENQDPGVAFVLNEQTGEVTPLVVDHVTGEADDAPAPAPKKRGRPKKKVEPVLDDELEQLTDPEVASAEDVVLPRELGS